MNKIGTIYDICQKVDYDIGSDFGGGCPIEKSFFMSYLVQNQGLKTYVEIGVYKGKSLFPVAHSVHINGGKSYGIDPYNYKNAEESDAPADLQDRINDFLPNVNFYKIYQDVIMYREKCGYGDSIKIIRETSQKAIEYFKENNIKIDFLHIDGNHDTKFVRQDFELYKDILADGGFIVFDDINWESVNIVYREAKETLTTVFECEHYGILYKGSKDFVKIEKLNRKLSAIHDKIKNKESKKSEDIPLVTVGVLTYNHENYIEECLRSIVEQKGNFRCKIIILDDNSTDNTKKIIENFLQNIEQSELLQIDYIRNKENLGVVKNYCKLINLIRNSKCDFFTFCEGDDFYLTNNRLESHLTLHLHHPELAFSFNKLLLYYQEKNKYEVNDFDFNDDKLSTESLVKDNKPGSLCASFYDSSILTYVKDNLFESMYTGDWMFNMFCSQFGDIRHINTPMSVYRKHSNGVWSGNDAIKNLNVLKSNIPKYNEYLNFLYDKEYQLIYDNCTRYLLDNNALTTYDIVVIDNIFPHPLSGFSYQEITSILENFENSAVYTAEAFVRCLSKDPIENLIISYKRNHPKLSDKVFKLSENSSFNAKLLYGIFLNTAHHDLLYWSEKLCTPFVFTLYPGGGFLLNDTESDAKLDAVFSSPWFRKVIVTQQVTYDYLIDKNLCKEEDIEYIFGVVTESKKINNKIKDKKHFGINKDTLDICFIAHKYSEKGKDKGYDLFIESAKTLSKQYSNILFHIVGPWDENVIDVSDIKNIIFYGSQSPDWLTNFYRDKDIIVSANINDVLAKGAFDGFPTTSVTDASLCEVAMFCTDPLNLNKDKFEDKKEIVILEHSSKDIVKKIKYYYDHPKELELLCKHGKLKSEYLYSFKNQIAPRMKLLREVIKATDEIAPFSSDENKVECTNGLLTLPNTKQNNIKHRNFISRVIRKITPKLIKRIYRKTRRIIKKIRQI